MKRFFTLLLIFTTFSVFGQNLIPNPSVEDYIECPDGLGGTPPSDIDHWVSDWINLRGSSDYFNSNCLPSLGWDNPFGFQEPYTGDGYLGIITYHTGLVNSRESVGIEFENPLVIGQTYYLSFYISTGFSPTYVMISNNIGFLLMEDNYLDSYELGSLPNHSTYATSEMILDTTNWVNISTSFIADSAYQYIGFGNFFSDELTDTLRLDNSIGGAVAYYYFDDFCLSTDPNECEILTSTNLINKKGEIILFPNPSSNSLNIESTFRIIDAEVFNLVGEQQLRDIFIVNTRAKIEFNMPQGIYIINILTEKGAFKKRFVVQ